LSELDHAVPIPVPGPKSVQDYIDETPRWPDGTAAASVPLTRMQWRIWGLAAAGKFFEGMIVFMTGVALPLIAAEFDMSAVQRGVVGAASLFGILVGALALGGLADRFGRKAMFIVEMMIFTVFLVLLAASPSYLWLVVCLFGIGVALGCDYPTAHLIISESIPSTARGRLVLAAFAFQAVGVLTGTAIGYLVLANRPDLEAWRLTYVVAIIPALLVVLGRFFVTESGNWLFAHGRVEEAAEQTRRLLRRDLFRPPYRRATILASLPWFIQDLGTYGIGIFTPTVLAAAIGHQAQQAHNLAGLIHNDILAAEGAAFIDTLLLVGVFAAILLTDRLGRIPMQILGFIGCAAGLLLASFSLDYTGATRGILLFGGFMLFNFMTNFGPNAQTYLLAGELFPTRIRGKGAGFAAAFAKMGAVSTAFLFPILLADIGTKTLLFGLVAASLLGALVTYLFRIETTGLNLEKLGVEKPGY
jgi:MFS family permease